MTLDMKDRFTEDEINIFKSWLINGDIDEIVREVGEERRQVQKTLKRIRSIFSKSKNYSNLLESMGIIEPMDSLKLTDKGRAEFRKRLSKRMEKQTDKSGKERHTESFSENKGFTHKKETEVYLMRSQRYGNKDSYLGLEKWFRVDTHPSVYAPHDMIAGNYNLETLTDEWYKWFLTTPLPSNPVTHPNNSGYDKTSYLDRNVFLFNKGDVSVYFTVTSPFLNPDRRTIIMTRRVPLLVPVYTKLASPEIFPSLSNYTSSQMVEFIVRDLANINGKMIQTIFDGEEIYGCCVLRIEPLKITNIPDDNILGLPANMLGNQGSTVEIYHGGFWLLLREEIFTPGDHLLFLRAQSINHEMEAKIQIKTLV
jgi:hypothetical protein